MDAELRSLIDRARRGDRAAFDRLARSQRDRVARLAWRLLGWASHDVDDVVQETFMEAWRTLDRLRNPDRIEAWLCGITANRCRTWRRAWQRRRRRDTRAAIPDCATDGPAPDDALGRAVRSAVTQLAPRDREVIVLRYLEELDPEAISLAIGISRSAVDVRLHRARARLGELLGGETGALAHD